VTFPPVPTLRDRASGVLLHPTSLPGSHGNGDLGAEAHAFAHSLARAGQRWWQMLPVGPAGYGESPYSAMSAFAGNPLLVDLDALGITIDRARFPDAAVDFEGATAFRDRHLRRAFESFTTKGDVEYAAFVERSAGWLDDFALFAALKHAHGGAAWTTWEPDLALRRAPALESARSVHAREIDFVKFVHWKFELQWKALRAHCTSLGIGLIGDVPIFVAHDSADVWASRELFTLDDAGEPTSISGVPPDYFSKTGQRWGNPLYRWARIEKTGFAWWVDRFRSSLDRFDAIRLDHFIGFVRFWRVPAADDTAVNGTWRKGPGRALFDRAQKKLDRGHLPFIAEDLGAVTPAVRRLRRKLELPGMRIVQFAFGEDPQVDMFLPHNHTRNAVVYTGTHDNDTIVGWFDDPGDGKSSSRSAAQTEAERQRALAYLGRRARDKHLEIHWEMIRLAMSSVAFTAIIPMQDVLGLGSEARMNSPGRASGNWRWRLAPDAFTPALEQRLGALTKTYGRAGASAQEKTE
jgi:4-alpha-glucanotransferase